VDKKKLKKCRLYVITAPRPDRRYEAMVRAIVAGGADIVQLRDKILPDAELSRVARRLGEICHRKGVLFIVNDRADIARISGADGIHLGPDDIGIKEARSILGPQKIIGYSVSGDWRLAKKAARDGADYISVGAIWKTPTKPEKLPVGLSAITRIKKMVKIPLVAIGGINKKNIQKVFAAGADMAAVVRAASMARDIRRAVRQLKKAIKTRDE